uniref:Polyprotein n=1 Tax=Haemonchus placei TaxID=6290 RepID=A0A0N4VW87_HAEPC
LTRYGRLGLLEEGTSGTCRGCRCEANYTVKGNDVR